MVHAIADIFRPELRYDAMIDLAPLREACWREEALQIEYRDGEGASTDRVILPLSLVYNDDCVTVLAWCCLRQDFRMFRTDRIADVQSGGSSFRPRRAALLRDYIQRLQAARAARNAL